jgi:uncharacterized protein (DUF1800 family)
MLGLCTRRGFRWLACRCVAFCAVAIATPAFSYDLIYHNGFQAVTDAPASDAEAARFLTMATFGPTAAEIAHLRSIGYGQWIDQQLAMPATLERPAVQALDAGVQNPGQSHRRAQWFQAAITAPDQLRQRAAWALSQILVASDQGNKLNQDPVALAEYYDTLARDAFGWFDSAGAHHAGVYPTLLADVTYSPAMAKMLTYVQNSKADPALNLSPDENYAREIMQLFSIGLIERNMDFSPKLDNGSNPIPTYTPAIITANARVFTGLSYDPNYSDSFHNYPTNGPGWAIADYLPLFCYESHHDEASKSVIDGNVIDNPAPNCGADIAQLLTILADHPNVAPFLSRQLIERFTTSNPTPAYIERIANVFVDNGHGLYGDLGAVVKAILTDPEAQYGAVSPPLPNTFGKAREPLLKLTAFWRYYTSAAPGGVYALSSTTPVYGQAPLDATSVFNFYLPDYQPPGELAAAGMFGPEFQIESESAVVATANDLAGRANAYVGNPANTGNTITVDLSALFALANDPASLVAQVNHDLMYGSMSSTMQARLVTMVGDIPYAVSTPQPRVVGLLQVVLASPEFAIEK